MYSIENLRKDILKRENKEKKKENEIKERHRNLVKVAERYYNDGLLNASKGLFESSLNICQQKQWEEGMNYAIKMIEEITNKIEALNKT